MSHKPKLNIKPNKNCLKCLRYNEKRKICIALNGFQWPCWTYIDDEKEFEKQQVERMNYTKLHSQKEMLA